MERATKPLFAKGEKDEVFYRVRGRVNKMIAESEPKYRRMMLIKAFLYPLLYFSVYAAALIAGKNPIVLYGCYVMLGLLLVINFLNLIHDAVHGVLFTNRRWNAVYVRFFDLLGANSYVWAVRHTRLHHNYPNILGWDSDVEQSPLARIFPHGAYSRIHKYQHIYLPFLYPLYLLNWLLIRDFKDFFNKQKPVWKVTTIPRA
ncbi:MAG TPA: fatty acid desaturase, partial [Puia sp.]